MEKSIIIAGYGGQGVLFFGTTLAHAAMHEGKNTTWIPSYGAEMRGGSANCSVKISDGEISSPIIDNADYGVFLNTPAINKFGKTIKSGGMIFGNLSMIHDTQKRNDIKYFFQPLNDVVSHCDEQVFLNIIALGMFIKNTQILKKESVQEALKQITSAKKPEFTQANLKSFELGFNLK